MEMTKGEFIDRLSILTLKEQKIGSDCFFEFIKYAEDVLYNFPADKIQIAVISLRRLYEINGEIWKLESDIRKGKEEELGLEEVGRRALQIRDWNNKRIAVQNEINKYFDEPLNIKKYHRSE